MSPVGAYYAEGFNPVKIYVEDTYVRAVPGGVGEAKTAGNYAASVKALTEAQNKGYTQVLWLDALEHKYIEEVGTSNIFFVIDDELITPPLGGTILPGITRDSVLQLARDNGSRSQKRRISIDEVVAARRRRQPAGNFQHRYGCCYFAASANSSTRVRSIMVNNGKTGELSQCLFDEYAGNAVWMNSEDPHNWVVTGGVESYSFFPLRIFHSYFKRLGWKLFFHAPSLDFSKTITIVLPSLDGRNFVFVRTG